MLTPRPPDWRYEKLDVAHILNHDDSRLSHHPRVGLAAGSEVGYETVEALQVHALMCNSIERKLTENLSTPTGGWA